MSDTPGRYRKVFPRLWGHPGFLQLTRSAREICLYVLSGPQSNAIGLFNFSPATAAEDLGVGAETFRKGLAEVCVTFGWQFDNDQRVFYIPSWWRWNQPTNPKHSNRQPQSTQRDPAECTGRCVRSKPPNVTRNVPRNVYRVLPSTFTQTTPNSGSGTGALNRRKRKSRSASEKAAAMESAFSRLLGKCWKSPILLLTSITWSIHSSR